jgi:anti-sigma factor RsiW
MADHPPLTDADRADLVAYLDGELDPAAQQRVEERLSLDPRTRAEADALKRTWDLLDHLPRPEPSPEFSTRTVDAVSALRPAAPRPPSPAPGWARHAGWAAALLAAAAVGYLVPGAKAPRPTPSIELEDDPLYAREPRVIEHLPLYLAADNLPYLIALDHPDLFGEDAPVR